MKGRRVRNNFGYKTFPYPLYSLDLLSIDSRFFKHPDNFSTKNIRSKREVQNSFLDLLASKLLAFYRTGIV